MQIRVSSIPLVTEQGGLLVRNFPIEGDNGDEIYHCINETRDDSPRCIIKSQACYYLKEILENNKQCVLQLIIIIDKIDMSLHQTPFL